MLYQVMKPRGPADPSRVRKRVIQAVNHPLSPSRTRRWPIAFPRPRPDAPAVQGITKSRFEITSVDVDGIDLAVQEQSNSETVLPVAALQRFTDNLPCSEDEGPATV